MDTLAELINTPVLLMYDLVFSSKIYLCFVNGCCIIAIAIAYASIAFKFTSQ